MLKVKLQYDHTTKYNIVKVENSNKEPIEIRAFKEPKDAFKEVEKLNQQLIFKEYGK